MEFLKIKIKSLKELQKFIKKLFKCIPKDTIILLNGELGVGKTQFTKFFANELLIKETVISPTFIKMNLYSGKNGDLLHIDGYYLNKNINLYEFIEYFDNRYVIIEWPDAFINYLKDYFVVNINIKYLKEKEERELEIKTSKEILNFLK